MVLDAKCWDCMYNIGGVCHYDSELGCVKDIEEDD